MYYLGYLEQYDNLLSGISMYLNQPDNSPIYWNNEIDYISTYLFTFYIAEKYGNDILRDLINESLDGPQGIEAIIQSAGYNITFNEIFLNWITALTIDEIGFRNNLFGFENCDPSTPKYDSISNYPTVNKSVIINHYAFCIHKLESPPGNFTVSVLMSRISSIGIILAVHDDFGWSVKQKLHYDVSLHLNESFSGSNIDEAYLITSYLSETTPTAPLDRDSDGGSSLAINISIQESE
jgi:hypothetical protein